VEAVRLIGTKRVYANGLIVQTAVWWLPAPLPPSRHRYKYRLYRGREGERIVGFDNERGKGDHRHIGGIETEYRFVSLEKLLADFAASVQQVTGRSP
jgi:Family of unknown function (DUF6516)